jgi:predicted RNA-binding Zn-ribbon protein involved in translation (DUF1610 family)
MERKYRQNGYMDPGHAGRERDRTKPASAKPLTPEERAQLRGQRHAVQREANEVVRCPDCGRDIASIGAIDFAAACPHCNAALHTCRACRHFDTSQRWECRATILERVMEKGKANRCATFEARLVLDATGKRSNGSTGGGDPKSQFENLFKR